MNLIIKMITKAKSMKTDDVMNQQFITDVFNFFKDYGKEML
jgi:hypothetical protein